MELRIPVKYIINRDMDNIAFTCMCYLALLFSKTGNNSFVVNHNVLKRLLEINDNRTLRKATDMLYELNILSDKIDTFKRNGNTDIVLSGDFIKEFTEPQGDQVVLNQEKMEVYLNLGMKYVKFLCYYEMATNVYLGNAKYYINYKRMCKYLGVTNETIFDYTAYLREHVSFKELEHKVAVDESSALVVGLDNAELNVIASKRNKIKKFDESQLEKMIIQNIECVEDGMTLIKSQAHIRDGIIDILAQDKSGRLCIIEVKVTSNDERVVFQSVYYPTQILGNPRMITIAPGYDYKIKVALEKLRNVELKVYEIVNGELAIKEVK